LEVELTAASLRDRIPHINSLISLVYSVDQFYEDIFMTCIPRIFISTIVAIAAIAGYAHSGNAQLSKFISVPVTSQTKTVPNTPFLAAQSRSLPSDPIFISQAMGGGSLEVSNGTNRDAHVKFVEPLSRKLVAAFHVKSNSTFTVNQIPDGTYRVIFALGKNWNPKTQSFTQSKSFAKFDKPLNYTTMQLGNRIRYRAFRITLHPVPSGKARTSSVNEQEFKRY
jgi:hypothetical protein